MAGRIKDSDILAVIQELAASKAVDQASTGRLASNPWPGQAQVLEGIRNRHGVSCSASRVAPLLRLLRKSGVPATPGSEPAGPATPLAAAMADLARASAEVSRLEVALQLALVRQQNARVAVNQLNKPRPTTRGKSAPAAGG